MRITITSNVAKVIADLDAVAQKQVPYASAVALTRVAQDVQQHVRGHLNDTFTVRNNWVSKGISIRSAKKQDWPNQQAEVGTRDEFMARQETGGTKQAKGSGNVAVPLAARENKSDITKPSQWPKALLRKRKFFIGTIKNGPRAGTVAVMRRVENERYPLQVMYLLKRSVDVKAKWDFREQAQTVALRQYSKRFGEALGKAIASSR